MADMDWYEPRTDPPQTGQRIHRFLQILKSPADIWLMIRMSGWAVMLPVLKRAVPLKNLAKFMWASPKVDRRSSIQEQKIATIIRWLYVFAFSKEKSCLQRSLILYRFLSFYHADPQLISGLRREAGMEWKGHAWVLVDGKEFAEFNPGVGEFKPILSFGTQGSMRKL
jgi:hypothetical protein